MSHKVYVDNELYVKADSVEPDEPLKPGYLSPHFRISEFDCNHCGKHGKEIDPELLAVLEDVREYYDSYIVVNSGVRCPIHNRAVDGAQNSTHLSEGSLTGTPCAADIVVNDVPPENVRKYLTRKYPDKYGIGKYSSFTHIDVRPTMARW